MNEWRHVLLHILAIEWQYLIAGKFTSSSLGKNHWQAISSGNVYDNF